MVEILKWIIHKSMQKAELSLNVTIINLISCSYWHHLLGGCLPVPLHILLKGIQGKCFASSVWHSKITPCIIDFIYLSKLLLHFSTSALNLLKVTQSFLGSVKPSTFLVGSKMRRELDYVAWFHYLSLPLSSFGCCRQIQKGFRDLNRIARPLTSREGVIALIA